MRQFEIRSTRPPYGVTAERRRTGIRMKLKSIVDEEVYIDLPDHVAQQLRDELTAALAATQEASE